MQAEYPPLLFTTLSSYIFLVIYVVRSTRTYIFVMMVSPAKFSYAQLKWSAIKYGAHTRNIRQLNAILNGNGPANQFVVFRQL